LTEIRTSIPRAIALSAALWLTVALGACGSGAIEPIHSKAQFGFNEDPAPGSFALQAKLDMPVRRLVVPWNAVEPRRGRWDWSRYDTYYEDILHHGLKPLIVAIGGPCWAATRCINGVGVPDPRADADWAEYARRLAGRYRDATGIEVWNEPNSVRQFPPHPDAVRFTTLLAEAYRAIKGVDPKLPVISGGLLPTTTTGSFGVSDAQFLAAMYRAGAARYMDAIGAHPYPIAFAAGGASSYDPDATEQDLDRLRAVRNAAGDGSKPIWITEMGVSTEPGGGFPPGASEDGQGDDLVRMLREVGDDPDVQVALVHRLMDTPAPAGVNPAALLQSGFGVFDSSGAPKPAACDLRRALGGTLHC
jgi:polysaccharide biosynthesis protein PslG